MDKSVLKIIEQLESFGVLENTHSHSTLLDHLKGTYNILKNWEVEEALCLAGLCHSIYGTESYKKETVSLDQRSVINKLIGKEAEELVYLFGAHQKENFWDFLDRENSFVIHDRFTYQVVPVSYQQISQLVTLTLANWLEQRPRVDEKYKFIREKEFSLSQRFLPEKAYEQFLIEYDLK